MANCARLTTVRTAPPTNLLGQQDLPAPVPYVYFGPGARWVAKLIGCSLSLSSACKWRNPTANKPNRPTTTTKTHAEPAKSLTFTVARTQGQQYNLTCQAGQTFPRPSLALFRYRAGPLDAPTSSQQPLRQNANRPKLAATLLRQEPIPGTQTQLLVNARRGPKQPDSSQELKPDLTPVDSVQPLDLPASPERTTTNRQQSELGQQPSVYEISAWALVDELSLSSNVVTQFECLLTIEGTSYEQRQSLALQRGKSCAPPPHHHQN